MSSRIGFLVVNPKTGFVLEGRDHASKIFADEKEARRACKPMAGQVPMRIAYRDIVSALLLGSSFCFDSEDTHKRFLGLVRNDPENRPFTAYSKERDLVRWRHTNEKVLPKTNPCAGVATNPGAAPVPAKNPPVEGTGFNHEILVR